MQMQMPMTIPSGPGPDGSVSVSGSGLGLSPASPSPASAAPFASASLYVGELQPDVTEALLFEIFNAVGPVQSVRVCRDATTRRSLGYAYVNFHRVDDAERALDTMNFKNIRNRPCRIMWSHRDPSLRKSGLGNIVVKNLAKTIENKQLYDTFSMFGNILSCKVSVNDKRESLGYGFVHYETEEAAQAAITRVDGKVIAGEKVSVQPYKAKERGGSDKFKYTNIFVKNLNATTSSSQLEGIFSKFGQVTSCVVNVDKEDPTRAFGFINFSTPEEATAAVEGSVDLEIDGKKLYVGRAQKKEQREKELREAFEALKLERQKKYVGVNLFVKNLSDEVDDAKLSNEFSKYGSIISAKIMRDPAGKSKGFGFVCFSSPEEATKAVTELNGKLVEGKPLFVALAQRKEARRQQLELQYEARAKAPMAGGFGMTPGTANAFASQQAAMQAMYAGAAGGSMMPFQGGMAQPRPFMYGQQGPLGPGTMMSGMMPQPNAGPQFQRGFGQGQQAGFGAGSIQQPGQQQRIGAGAGAAPMMGMNQQQMMNMPYGMQPNLMQGAARPMMQNGLPLMQRGPANAQQNQPGVRGSPLQQNSVAAQRMQTQQMPQSRPGVAGPASVPKAGIPPHVLAAQQQQQQQRFPGQRGPGLNGPVPLSAPESMVPSPNEPLTIKALAAAPEELRKQMIGERLFPLVKARESALAGKITGMLLEMDNGELIHLLESPEALHEKVGEALIVLSSHASEGE